MRLRQQRENKLPVAGVARLRASRFKTEFWRIRLRPQVRYYPANALVPRKSATDTRFGVICVYLDQSANHAFPLSFENSPHRHFVTDSQWAFQPGTHFSQCFSILDPSGRWATATCLRDAEFYGPAFSG